MFFVQLNGELVEFSLGTNYDITSASAEDSSDTKEVVLSNGNSTGFAFNRDGTKLFTTDNNADEIDQYILTTGFDISTISHETSLDITDNTPKPRSISMSTVSPSTTFTILQLYSYINSPKYNKDQLLSLDPLLL